MFRIGLTGGIGSGKSTVAELLRVRGAGLVDTDAIAHRLTAPGGAAIDAIRTTFGSEFIGAGGALDRARMRALVFADGGAKRRLEAILHPLIRAQADEETRAAARGAPYVVVVVPLLVESGNWRQRVERVLVVDCTQAAQIERVTRRGLTADAVRAIIAQQASCSERLAAADDIVFNEWPLPALAAHADRLHALYLRLAGAN